MTYAVRAFIRKHLGNYYLKPPLLSLEASLSESDPLIPLIFILTSGNDPQAMLTRFASAKNINLYSLSLGKAQGERASRIIREAVNSGGWVLLQNCHLALSWMPELESIIERLISDTDKGLISVHSQFRL